ncbi:hypothetical protein GT370_05240 [Acidocella sp. MX-AZ03]|uniref:hypothetical protein n=1 Tax=Acidocella sp. MX-AZ03 TaxID=2697363 RepID=UPI0022DCECEC|nr:hypothetical protein [Acidocella sp. MX-AZ03]WBO60230.1 hypothetical protein GT370_05240 [Acidocella sp. MX-AZ03]
MDDTEKSKGLLNLKRRMMVQGGPALLAAAAGMAAMSKTAQAAESGPCPSISAGSWCS